MDIMVAGSFDQVRSAVYLARSTVYLSAVGSLFSAVGSLFSAVGSLFSVVGSLFKRGRQSILQNNALEQCHIRVKSRCLSSLNNSFFEKSAYHTKKRKVKKQSPLLSLIFNDGMTFLYQIFTFSRIEVVSENATALHATRAVTNAALN